MSNPTFEQVFGSLLRDKTALEALSGARVCGMDLHKSDGWLTVRLSLDLSLIHISPAPRCFEKLPNIVKRSGYNI